MERLLAGLRNVVRAENGWLELRGEPVDLARLVAGAIERGQVQSPDHRFILEQDGSVVGDWDPERIDQILDNLIGNAIKYSDLGGTVRIELTSDGETARIRVADEGIGIAPEMLSHLFDRFYRASQGGAVQGMGFGLYIVRTLVQAKGGRISVASRPGAGSTFTVELPLRRGSAAVAGLPDEPG